FRGRTAMREPLGDRRVDGRTALERDGETEPREQELELGFTESAHVRRVAQTLDLVVQCGLVGVLRGDLIGDQEASAWPGHADHLPDHDLRTRKMVHGGATGRDVE